MGNTRSRAEGGRGRQDRRHLGEGAWRRAYGGETSGAQVSTTRGRAQSTYDGERECGARFGGRDGRVAVLVRVASRLRSCRRKAETNERNHVEGSHPTCATDFRARWRAFSEALFGRPKSSARNSAACAALSPQVVWVGPGPRI